jgi:hypothetical protein
VRQRADFSRVSLFQGSIVVEPSKIHKDTIDSLLDRIGILREQLISIERSLERMKNSQPKNLHRRDQPPRS